MWATTAQQWLCTRLGAKRGDQWQPPVLVPDPCQRLATGVGPIIGPTATVMMPMLENAESACMFCSLLLVLRSLLLVGSWPHGVLRQYFVQKCGLPCHGR
jgi:hypothetical protein